MSTSHDIPAITIENPSFHFDESYKCPYQDRSWHQKVTVKQLAESATKGCPVCFVVHCILIGRFSEHMPDHVVMRHTNLFDAQFSVWSQSNRTLSRPILLFVQPFATPSPVELCRFFTSIVQAPRMTPFQSTASSASLETAMNWLQQCTRSHSLCGSSANRPLPTRVLNVDQSSVFLYESKGEPARYACLSHCWGPPQGAKMLRTTKDTLAQFKKDIPWQQLPINFQHAISFARRLGLVWIWIDALCIVQDDPLDWEKEAAQMASIYQNSYVTLGATKSSHADGGFFTTEHDRLHAATKTPAKLVLNEFTTPIYAEELFEHVTLFPGFTQHHKHTPFPLLQRAWVYQERLLSPRFLHFTPYELNWECREINECECGTASEEASFRAPKARFTHALTQLRTLDGSKSVELDSTVPDSWRTIVKQYTTLDMTYSKDVFPALAGLSKEWQAVTGDEYLAGLWKSTFIRDMLWEIDGSQGEPQRPIPWRAPSWSWASISHVGVTWDPGSIVSRERADIVEVKCTTKGLARTGELSSAYLILSARVITGRVFYPERVVDSRYPSSISLPMNNGSYTTSGGFLADVSIWEDGPSYVEPHSYVHVAMIADMRSDAETPLIPDSRYFLVLKKRSGDSETYERIGLLRVYSLGASVPNEAYEAAKYIEDQEEDSDDDYARAQTIGAKMTESLFQEFDSRLKTRITIV
ncbi:HET-domain-containing protein [Zopfia rhizophila CBS 207.26]|uniref:HET-domain-containing protein n=1 Tax=Zopfia rhizophila CBS 207.26 TaxID=1314779 RepID=A0A6A6DKS2_9PEZI|nr:HET-domain-containing protein [Zopfia rhizophila CBS 207.26]